MVSQRQEQRLVSPGEGVYRVRLSAQHGRYFAEAFFAGSQAEETVELPNGNYWAVVEDVTTGWTSPRVPLSLSGLRTSVPLGTASQRSNAERQVIAPATSLDHRASSLIKTPGQPLWKGLAPPIGGTGVSRQARGRDETGGPEFKIGLSRGGDLFGSIIRRRSDVPFRPEELETRFEVGISEDATPGTRGSWRVPEDVTVRMVPANSPGTLTILVSRARGIRKTRVRMSVGIEGRPTIRVPLPLFSGGLEVSLRSRLLDGSSDLSVSVSARKPRVRALMAAVDELSAEEAVAVVGWAAGEERLAMEVLHQKVDDLWAATVAGLALIRSGGVEKVKSWMYNLARLAPHISDASIAAAWTAIAFPDGGQEEAEERAINYLIQARRIGAPSFVVGNSLALDLLGSLRLAGATAKIRRRAAEEYQNATKRSRYRLFRSPFMIWEQRGEKLQGGRLPGTRYRSVARGLMTPEGFTIAT